MEEFYQNNVITIWAGALAIEIALGLLAQVIAERKGHSKRWFWAGFFFSLIGVIWTAGLPDEKLRRKIKQLGESRAAAGSPLQQAAAPAQLADDTELIAVLSAAIAAIGTQQGRQYILRSFRPAGAGSTAWSRAARVGCTAR